MLLTVISLVALRSRSQIPVVADFVVVPLDDLRHRGVEPAHVLVHQVVLMVAAELVERLGDLRLRPVTMFFQIEPSSSFTSAGTGWSA